MANIQYNDGFVVPEYREYALATHQRSEAYGLRALLGPDNIPRPLRDDLDAFTAWSTGFVVLDRWVP